MTEQEKAILNKDKERDPDMAGAEAALKRAAQRARDRARAAGTGIIVMQDGRIVEVSPDTPVA